MNKQILDITGCLHPPFQESFRLLSTNLGLHRINEKLKLIAVTSFNQEEGKTTVVINLAFAAANSGRKVLFIDADLRRTGKSKNCLEGYCGLTDLCEESNIEDVICGTNIQNLNCVTAGNGSVDPCEFLCSPVFDRFLEYASSHYDLVLIDTPSMGGYADSAIIASKVSGVLVVARFQKTSYKNIERIKWQMGNAGANIIGIVVNRVTRRDFKSYFILRKEHKG